MEYTVLELARLSGVSARTLRYYDQIGLLKPETIAENGYRLYGPVQVDALQQILFYRALGLPLAEISRIVSSPAFNRKKALQTHLQTLAQKKKELERMMRTVRETLRSMEGETMMSDQEKFTCFKQNLIAENERQYGCEIREKYGEETVDASNKKLSGMSEEQWAQQEALSQEILLLLGRAMQEKNPACPDAQKACALHRRWLCLFWKEGTYSKQAHRSMGELYTGDERFRSFYDGAAGGGAAAFFKEALDLYTK